MVTKEGDKINSLFYYFIVLHVCVWTFIPYLARYTLPMDALEGTIWGRQFAWGYDKNPFLNGWLTHIAVLLGGQGSSFAIYLFSQLSVGLCFIAVWKLAKKILPKIYAFFAVIILDGIHYYNLHAIDFNDNTLELSLWALTILFFYKSLKNPLLKNWLVTGFFAGLSMMTKYYTIMLLIPMFIFMLLPENREHFKKINVYAGLLLFLVIISPHMVWLTSHDFVTVNYAFDRVSAPYSWLNHFSFPAEFAWQQVEAFLPALALFLFLVFGKKPFLNPSPFRLASFDFRFLIYVGIGPFLLTLLLSLVMGFKLRAGWGQPLLSLWGILLLGLIQPYITAEKFYRFLIIFLGFFATTAIAYTFALLRADDSSSAVYPAQFIATELTREWHEKYHRPLKYIAGTRWAVGTVSYYSKDAPLVYINWDKKLSPWIDEKKLNEEGAIFIWDESEYNMPSYETIAARFKNLTGRELKHYTWLRNPSLRTVEMQVGFIPPKDME